MTYAQTMAPEGFVAARGRTIAITVLLITQIVVLAAAAVAWSVASAAPESDLQRLLAAFATAGGLDMFDGLLAMASFIVFLTWVYRATANLPALGSMTCKYTPGWAVGWYFIPFANIVHGHQVMANIWTESQPPAVNENGFYLPRKATLVHWWWGVYWFTVVAGWAVGTGSALAVGPELHSVADGQMFLHALRIADALLFMLMVRTAQKRQEEQWADLERRRNVPKPTADALR